jgi:hypothetical protein
MLSIELLRWNNAMAIHIQNPPEAKPERISRLVTRIEQGDVKVPVFQRKFVWKPGQILELLDSIYSGYPIGSLLFWLSSEPLATERNLGNFPLPGTPDKYPRNYVLDGQQRLATIYGVLRWDGKPEEEHIFNVSFDLERRVFLPTRSPAPPTHIPMNVIFDTKKFRLFQTNLLNRPDGQSLIDATDVLSETFREYAIPVVTVTEATVEHVSSIFERINNTGTKLTVYDLMVAATWTETFDLREQVERTLAELDRKDFGDISPVAILQVLAAHSENSANKQAIFSLRKKKDSDALSKSIDEIQEALKRAVDFLNNDLSVKSSDFLPYERQLVALGYAFGKRPRMNTREIAILKRWFWRTSFSERYRRGGEGLFDDDLTNIVAALDDATLLEVFGGPATTQQIAKVEFRKTGAFSNAFIAMLASHGPRNLVNGSLIDTGKALSTYNRKEFHHIFPQAFLAEKGIAKSRIHSLANICMLSADQNKQINDRRPSDYVKDLQQRHGSAFTRVFESNLIPQEAIDSLLNDNYEEFVEIRASHIASIIVRSI